MSTAGENRHRGALVAIAALVLAILTPVGARLASANHEPTRTYLVPGYVEPDGSTCCFQAEAWSLSAGADLRTNAGGHPVGGSALGLAQPAGGAQAAAVLDRVSPDGAYRDALDAFDDMAYWSRREAHSAGPSDAQAVLEVRFERRPVAGTTTTHVARFEPRRSAWAPEAAVAGAWQRFTTTGTRGSAPVRGWTVDPPIGGACTSSATCTWAEIVNASSPTDRITSVALATPGGPDEFWGGVDAFSYTYREPLIDGGVYSGPGGPRPYTETREVFHYLADFDARQPEGTVELAVRRPGEATLVTAGAGAATHVTGPALPGTPLRGAGSLSLDASGAGDRAGVVVGSVGSWFADRAEAVVHRTGGAAAPRIEVDVVGHPSGPSTLVATPSMASGSWTSVSAAMDDDPLTPRWTVTAAVGSLAPGTTYSWKQVVSALVGAASPGAARVVADGGAAGGVDVASVTHTRTVGIDLEPAAAPTTTTTAPPPTTTTTSTTSTTVPPTTTTTVPPSTTTTVPPTTTTTVPTTTTSTTSTTVPPTTTSTTVPPTTTTTVPGGGPVVVSARDTNVTLLGSYQRLSGEVAAASDGAPVPGVYLQFFADRDGNGTYETLLCGGLTNSIGSADCTADLGALTLQGHGIAAFMATQTAVDGRVWLTGHGLARANLVLTRLTYR